MPPILHSSNSSAEPAAEIKSTLEFSMLTIALITSIVLALIKEQNFYQKSRAPVFMKVVSFFAMIFTGIAFILTVFNLYLGWSHTISFGSMASIAFALVPAIMSVPLEVLQYSNLIAKMEQRRSLSICPEYFRYIRFGSKKPTQGTGPTQFRKCGSDRNARNWSYTWGVCRREHCDVGMFIRCLSHPRTKMESFLKGIGCFLGLRPASTTFFNMDPTPHDNSGNSTPPAAQDSVIPGSPMSTGSHSQTVSDAGGESNGGSCTGGDIKVTKTDTNGLSQWNGNRVGHTKHYVMLQDITNGITAQWWGKVYSSTHLVMNPSLAHVGDETQMLNALSLLSDIIAIGDLVLKHRKDYFEHQLQKNGGVRASVAKTPGIMCTRIFEEVGLHGWGPIGVEMIEEQYTIKAGATTKYGIIFWILCEKSRMFRKLDVAPQGQTGENAESDERTPLLSPQQSRNPARESRISAQDILDALMQFSGSTDEFQKEAKNLVDKWLKDWGCDLQKYHSEIRREAQASQNRSP